ncbi:MAG: ABC transporter permease [Planctomycetes bacterium]|nr:ABC transporter permease [Planctomycetota bacterium]
MGLVLRYSFRNLWRHKVRSLLTALTVAMVVAVCAAMAGFSRGVLVTARQSGSPANVIVLDRKAANQTLSKLSPRDLNLLKSLPQVKHGQDGEALISPEAVQQARINAGAARERPGLIRGVQPIVFDVCKTLTLTHGEKPSAGRKVAVGALVHTALRVDDADLAIGKVLEFQNEKWTIVGRFSAGGTALDSEILCDLSDVMAVYKRSGYSTAVFTAASVSEVPLLIKTLNQRNDIQIKAVREVDYYASLAEGYERVIVLAVTLAFIVGIGGIVSGTNTMYAAVLARIRELGTLRVLGFGPGLIVFVVLAESMALALVGGAAGLGMAHFTDGFSARLAGSTLTLVIDHVAMISGGAVALAIGLIGALIPAWRAARIPLTAALH